MTTNHAEFSGEHSAQAKLRPSHHERVGNGIAGREPPCEGIPVPVGPVAFPPASPLPILEGHPHGDTVHSLTHWPGGSGGLRRSENNERGENSAAASKVRVHTLLRQLHPLPRGLVPSDLHVLLPCRFVSGMRGSFTYWASSLTGVIRIFHHQIALVAHLAWDRLPRPRPRSDCFTSRLSASIVSSSLSSAVRDWDSISARSRASQHVVLGLSRWIELSTVGKATLPRFMITAAAFVNRRASPSAAVPAAHRASRRHWAEIAAAMRSEARPVVAGPYWPAGRDSRLDRPCLPRLPVVDAGVVRTQQASEGRPRPDSEWSWMARSSSHRGNLLGTCQ